jgi:LPXTG-motif cell wall-anchored protein
MTVLALTSLATVGMTPFAFAEEPYYSNEDGSNTYVDNCDGANFTVTIDGTEYSPGDVASGFSLSSNYSVSADDGVTVGWAPLSVVQGNYGHGFARNPLLSPADSDVSVDSGEWVTLNSTTIPGSSIVYDFFPSIFYAECPGEDGFAYIQTFPGLTLDQAGYAADLEQGVYLADQAQLDSLALDPTLQEYGGVTYSPMSNFRNAAYAFWANFFESEFLANQSAIFSFVVPLILEGDPVQAVWGWTGWYTGDFEYTEFASSFYSYSNGSEELTQIGIDDVFEEEGAPTTAPASTTTTPKLATTGANVEWLMVAGLIAAIAGAGFLAVSRRKRTA